MTDVETRLRASNLFQFLRELTLLRSPAVRTLDKYDKTFWFSDIPDAGDCFSVYKGASEERSEVWLEVTQPKVPRPPSPPDCLAAWIDTKQLFDASLESPPIRSTISRKVPIEDDSSVAGGASPSAVDVEDVGVKGDLLAEEAKNVQLSIAVLAPASEVVKKKKLPFGRKEMRNQIDKFADFPDLQEAWQAYVSDKWRPWAELAKPYVTIQKLYDDLYEMYQKIETLAENYELLLAVGCLSWTTPSSQKVFRHVLTTRASLQFDAELGRITIGAPLEGAKFVAELDMLEVEERPSHQQKRELDLVLESLNDDFWNDSKLSKFLESFVHAISSRGVYSGTLEKPSQKNDEPSINLAPAIILRPRTELGFVRLFDEMIKQIADDGELPVGIERLVSIVDDDDSARTFSGSSKGLVDEEIYFPLPANSDQREIAERLKSRQGILVQGPPGTGKSHTIANLVCHLLASGKRVLVTSHTPRALTVLRDKFPPEMQALCVSVVGDDGADTRKALEDSVAGITSKHNNWNPRANSELILELHEKLDDIRKGEQWALQSLRATKEKDTYKHVRKFSYYDGTAQEIARQLKSEENAHGWVLESIGELENEPLTNEDFSRLLFLLRKFDADFEKLCGKNGLNEADLLSPADFTELNLKIQAAKALSAKSANLKNHESYKASSGLKPNEREALLLILDELIALFFQIQKRPESFAQKAAREIIGDHDRKWRELLAVTKEGLEAIGSNYRAVAQKNLDGLANRDLHTVNADGNKLKEHFSKGGKIGFGPFRSKVVKDSLYLLKEVRVNGALCDQIETLNELSEILNTEIIVKNLRKNWSGISDEVPDSVLPAISTFYDYCEPLEAGLNLYAMMSKLREVLLRCPSLIAPQWDDIESIRTFRDVIASGASEEELASLEKRLLPYETKLRTASSDVNAHPLLQQLLSAFIEFNTDLYHAHHDANRELLNNKKMIEEKNLLVQKLSKVCKLDADKIVDTAGDTIWDSRKDFSRAWNWSRANKWIISLNDPLTLKRYIDDLQKSQSDIRDTLKALASAKAWEHTFKRLTESQRQHLVSWSMAVRRIGKGTGKHAEKHRKDARTHMDQCRGAIPAWIMPIHKVVETIKPGRDAFDVIIVDEASQSGPEALFLLYLGTQLVVVGDDKQISPEFVGLDRTSVDALREQFLQDVPHSDAIGVDHSLFDQAKIRYRGRVRLREHFRCMPEIIQFSNNLCYASDPLIPLRQYGGGRISPVVKTIYVQDGYIDDKSTKPVNKPEADAVIAEVKRICSDPAYTNKTIGIISLLNTSGQEAYLKQELSNSEKHITKQEYIDRNIRIGDAYQFQGDERDIIILSMVAAPVDNKRIYPMSAEKDERRFNVAVSRARDQLILFHSATLNDLNPKCIRHKLLAYCLDPHVETALEAGFDLNQLQSALVDGYAAQLSPLKPFDSWFEVDVFLRIANRGYRVIPQVEINNYKVDLIVEGMRGRLAIECDGDRWHGPERYDEDMGRQRDLERCGMNFWRVRGSAFYHDADLSMNSLWALLEKMEIYPRVEKTIESDVASEFAAVS